MADADARWAMGVQSYARSQIAKSAVAWHESLLGAGNANGIIQNPAYQITAQLLPDGLVLARRDSTLLSCSAVARVGRNVGNLPLRCMEAREPIIPNSRLVNMECVYGVSPSICGSRAEDSNRPVLFHPCGSPSGGQQSSFSMREPERRTAARLLYGEERGARPLGRRHSRPSLGRPVGGSWTALRRTERRETEAQKWEYDRFKHASVTPL